ncbi:amidinotransferase [Wenzhouxiangella sp. AB-CW3]|uniref:arginine deiminase-related protein n=1 Tax=Wenzhouxiangella sp. AB-CW3 TaxID=2771012 RepID=UPI00168B4C5F|nr:arginine deiminase-related protein [Wenzhouxiangella sp. AB-CW3]QOC23318.1 amidinotransferase [Wenzhouxiangella sp. AB-CW3]
MIVRTPEEFRRQIDAGWLNNDSLAVPRAVFLVEPATAHLSEQSARDNVYMDLSVDIDAARRLDQHRQLAERITACGVPVVRFPGGPDTPDDLFPNNVFATAPGRFIVGAMRYPDRQAEAQRGDIRSFFTGLLEYEEIDLSRRDMVAELTGALIIDRARRIGFCGMTQRVDDAGCQAMHEAFGLALSFQFELQADEYHTNVVMAVLASRALVICPSAFVDPDVPAAIAEAYPGHVLEITAEEKVAFAGNCIAVSDQDVFFSQTAIDALKPESLGKLESWGFRIHGVELDEIEKAGGSLRCCVAEIY